MFGGLYMINIAKKVIFKAVEEGTKELKKEVDDRLDTVIEKSRRARMKCPIYFEKNTKKNPKIFL